MQQSVNSDSDIYDLFQANMMKNAEACNSFFANRVHKLVLHQLTANYTFPYTNQQISDTIVQVVSDPAFVLTSSLLNNRLSVIEANVQQVVSKATSSKTIKEQLLSFRELDFANKSYRPGDHVIVNIETDATKDYNFHVGLISQIKDKKDGISKN